MDLVAPENNFTDWIETPQSSNLKRIRYDEQNMVLDIEFMTDRTYRYYDVQPHHFNLLVKTASQNQGQYFNRIFRNSFPFKEITEHEDSVS